MIYLALYLDGIFVDIVDEFDDEDDAWNQAWIENLMALPGEFYTIASDDDIG